jgi:GMP synthase (glutamine-hydrolysing)
LGICLGFQLWARHIGATVEPGGSEYGPHRLKLLQTNDPDPDPLFSGDRLLVGLCDDSIVIQSHGDTILPEYLTVLATTDNLVAAGRYGHLWGVQFHPEVSHTEGGLQIFQNFCFYICGASKIFPSRSVAHAKVEELRRVIGDQRVLLALSGGSDSSVLAGLLKRAVPGQIEAVYIKAVDRPDDEDHVRVYFGKDPDINLEIIDATDRFLDALRGLTGMHQKRVAVRSVYKPILEEAARRHGCGFIAQGTLYTDVVESGGGLGGGADKAQIKLHHNVDLNFELPELTPLDDCVKDTARSLGRELKVDDRLLTRHPFPGPGLVVRIVGEITAERLVMAKAIDAIFIRELYHYKLYDGIWQAGATLLNDSHTFTKGDDKGNGPIVCLWAVTSIDGYTAQPVHFDWDFLEYVSNRVTNEVPGIGAVSLRLSGKPPATIEFG